MYVCLCLGITTESVRDTVDNGARSTRQVAAACGAGSQCGRCRRTVRAIIESRTDTEAASRHGLWSRVRHLSSQH